LEYGPATVAGRTTDQGPEQGKNGKKVVVNGVWYRTIPEGHSRTAARPVTLPDPEVEHHLPYEPILVEGRREGFRREEEEKDSCQAGRANDRELEKLCSGVGYERIQDAARKRRPEIRNQRHDAEGISDLAGGPNRLCRLLPPPRYLNGKLEL
jgi:hypothetical protein